MKNFLILISLAFFCGCTNSQTSIYFNKPGGGGTFVPYSGATANVDLNGKQFLNFSRGKLIAATQQTNANITTPITGSLIPLYITNTLAVSNNDAFQTDWDPVLTTARTVDPNSGQNAHDIVAASIFQKNSNGWAHNAFTDNCKYNGAADYNHHACFQSQFQFNGTGTLTDYFGYFDGLNISNTGTVTNKYSFYAYPSYGGGNLKNQYGFYCKTMNTAESINEAIHIETNESYIGGRFKMATTSTAANVDAPAIDFLHATTVKTARIKEKILNNSSELLISVATYNFANMQDMLELHGNDDNTNSDYLKIHATKLILDASKINFSAVPTSSVGLPSGYIYSASGVLMITP